MSDNATSPETPRPPKRAGKPGAKQRHYKRWNLFSRIAVTLTLLACVAAGVVFLLQQNKDEGVGSTRALLDDIAKGLEDFARREGRLPNTIAEMVGPASPYKGAPIPEDYWRTRIEYRVVPDATPGWRVRSLGADKQAGTADDIVLPEHASWPAEPGPAPTSGGSAQPGSGR